MALSGFLKTIGVDWSIYNEMLDPTGGQKLNLSGFADVIGRFIKINQSDNTKEMAAALTEETAHFFVEILDHMDAPLMQSMLRLIPNSEIYNSVSRKDGYYDKFYEGDEHRLKKEAIAKLITQHIAKKPFEKQSVIDYIYNKENPENLSRFERWWQRVINFFKNLFGTNTPNSKFEDPFVQASQLLMQNKLEEYLHAEGMLNEDLSTVTAALGEYWDVQGISGILPRAATSQKTKTNTSQEELLKKLDANDMYESKPITREEFLTKYPKMGKYFDEVSEGGTAELYVGKPGTPVVGEILANRISHAASIRFRKNNPQSFATEEEERMWKETMRIRQLAGTTGHSVLERLLKIKSKDLHNGNLETVAMVEYDSGYSKAQFLELKQYVDSMYTYFQNYQNKLNRESGKKGKVVIRTEQFVGGKTNTPGRIDALAIFSNGDIMIHDYKFTAPSSWKGDVKINKQGKMTLLKDPFSSDENKMIGYQTSMSGYKETLAKEYNVDPKQIIETRIIPAVHSFEIKDGLPTGKILDLQIGGPFMTKKTNLASQFLDPIPVAGETTGIKELDALIIGEERRLKRLINSKKDAPFAQKESIQNQIEKSRNILQNLRLNQDIGSALSVANNIVEIAKKGLSVNQEFNKDGKRNEGYLSDEMLREMYLDLKYYQGYLGQSTILKRLRKQSKAKADLLEKALAKSSHINTMLTDLGHKLLERSMDEGKKRGVTGLDSFNKNVSYMTSHFTPLSTHTNPYHRILWDMVNKVDSKIVHLSKELAREIHFLEKELHESGATYDDIINPKTMNLYAKWSEKWRLEKKEAIRTRDIKWIKDNFEIDNEKYNKNFKRWKDTAYRVIESSNLSKDLKQQKKNNWLKKWDLKASDEAWLNPSNLKPYGFATIKEGVEEANMSEEYRRIQQTPALKNFYDYHRKMTNKFAQLYGVDLNEGFIANVHKGLIDTWVQNGFNPSALTKTGWEMFQIREHDLSFGMQDNQGNFERRIPRLFVRPLKTKDGDIDPGLKSKDLAKNLYLMGIAAHQYSLHSEILPSILNLELLLKEDIVQEMVEDNKGDLLKRSFNAVETKMGGTNAETFTDFVNMYIFGRHLKTKDTVLKGMGNVSVNKGILALKQYHTISALGLSIPVAAGAWGAGMISLEVQASKNTQFTRKQLWSARKAIATRNPKVRAIMEFFEISLEDLTKRKGDLLSATFRQKWMNTDRWFELLARADKNIDAHLAVAMAQNHGIDPKTGKLKRLKQLPEGTISLWDSIQYEKDPKWKIGSPLDKYIVTLKGVNQQKPTSKMTKDERAALDAQNVLALNVWTSFRNRVRKMGNKTKGTLGKDDLMLFNNTMMGKLFLHYRSWLPGLAFERFGATRYDHVLEQFDQGTWRALFSNIGPNKDFENLEQAMDYEVTHLEHLGAIFKDLTKIGLDITTFGITNQFKPKKAQALRAFDEWLDGQTGNPEFEGAIKGTPRYEELFEEFLEMKRSNIKAALAELRAVILLLLSFWAIGGDWDKDGKDKDINNTWGGRKLHGLLHRVYREIAFFADPREITGPRSSGVPLIGFAHNGYNLVVESGKSLGYTLTGTKRDPRDTGPEYYWLKMTPFVGVQTKFIETHPQHKTVQ